MYSHGHTSTDTLGDVMANGTNSDGWPYTPGSTAPRDQGDDHEDQCMARHPGFGCTCEQIQFEDRQREVAAEQPCDHNPLTDDGCEKCVTADAQRIHFVELLDRAAALIDPDAVPPTHEQRLDWLAKWRETVGR